MEHTKPAMYALLRLHADLGGKIQENKEEATRLSQSMVHVEAVLKMLEPGYDVRPIAVKRRQANPWFKRGTVFRTALDVLRKAEKPLTPGEIASRMLASKGVENPSSRIIQGIRGAVQASLKNHKGGRVIADEERSPVRWSLG